MDDSFQLNSDYKLTEEQIEEYQQNGHILLRNICSEDEINIYHNAISDESEQHFHEYIKSKNLKIVKSGNMKAGDITFHNGWTLHSAGPNNSNKLREVMTIIYYPSETKLSKPDNKNREFDFDALFKNNKPGELACSDLAPILYKE